MLEKVQHSRAYANAISLRFLWFSIKIFGIRYLFRLFLLTLQVLAPFMANRKNTWVCHFLIDRRKTNTQRQPIVSACVKMTRFESKNNTAPTKFRWHGPTPCVRNPPSPSEWQSQRVLTGACNKDRLSFLRSLFWFWLHKPKLRMSTLFPLWISLKWTPSDLLTVYFSVRHSCISTLLNLIGSVSTWRTESTLIARIFLKPCHFYLAEIGTVFISHYPHQSYFIFKATKLNTLEIVKNIIHE